MNLNYENNRLYFEPIPTKHHLEIKSLLPPGAEEPPRLIPLVAGGIILVFIGAVFALSGSIGIGLIPLSIGGGCIAGFLSREQHRRDIIATNTEISSKNKIITEENAKIEAKNKEIDDFNKNRTVVTGVDLDRICADYLKSNLESMALQKLGIDKELVQAIAPICFDGYYFGELRTLKPKVKKGTDGKERSSCYTATIFFFSTDQVYCYQLIFSLLESMQQETTEECFYRDIVSISTMSDTFAHDSEGQKSTVSSENFTLTTSGGTKMAATVFDTGTVERTIRDMRNLLRSKRQ